jgi:hypothetical protein
LHALPCSVLFFDSACFAASFLSKRLNINAATVNLAIWDTAGQERFHALGPIYYRDADGNRLPLSGECFLSRFFFEFFS